MNSYTKIESIHVHNTTQVENITFYKPRINKSIGKNLLVYRGNSIWNEINNSIKRLNWNSFKKQFEAIRVAARARVICLATGGGPLDFVSVDNC